jgi:site-specific DNA-cytosine methylase
VDHDRSVLATYAQNHAHPILVKNLNDVRTSFFAPFHADLWWMSPPCQPHTVRGLRRDLDDPRARSFVSVVRAIGEIQPSAIGLENVPGFAGSRAHALLRDTLDRVGYEVVERNLCPSWLGVPNERLRFYLVAGRGLRAYGPLPSRPIPLRRFLCDASPDLDVEAPLRARFGAAFHVVDADDERAVAACFTSAYGRSPVYSGSYLRDGDRLRRFSPREIAGLLGFSKGFRFPDGLPHRKAWDQIGNSVSVDAVREVLSVLF